MKPNSDNNFHQAPRILIVGGGYVGMYAARRLRRRLRNTEATVTVVDPRSTMTYQPFLAEAASGSIEPRHVVVPLRQVLQGCEVVTARVTGIDLANRVTTAHTETGQELEMTYDTIVLAPGSMSRTMPVPGLAHHAIGFSTLAEAVHLRNHVLSRLDAASAIDDREHRSRLLTFTVIGGGYSGVELIAELEDMARHALRYHPRLTRGNLRWLLIEASDRILPEVSLPMSHYTQQRLTRRGIEVCLGTRLESVTDGLVRLSDGEEFASDTIVWTAGVRANPLVTRLGLPIDHRGRIVADAQLRVPGCAGVWAAGDAAAVPDLSSTTPGAVCAPSAQHAVRQAKRLADNIIADLRGRPLKDYRHAYAGSVASLGLHKGVAEIYGVRLRGWPAWMVHRLYHLSRTPTWNRRARVLLDWTLTSMFTREVVTLEQIENPRQAWELASRAAG